LSAPEASSAARAAPPTAAGRLRAFATTWLSYATYYLGRKGFPVARAAMEEALGKGALQGVETGYLAMYAVGQFVSGNLGDRVGARRLVGYGMLLSAAACFAFGCGSAGAVFLVAMLVNGLAQSTGWPGNVKAMAAWFPKRERGRAMGLWATCYQVGGIVATAIAQRCLSAYGFRGAFIGPALCIAAVGLLVLFTLQRGPESRAADEPAPAVSAEEIAEARRRVLRSVTVWSYGTSYFCIKLIRYSLLFWLPYYLETALHYSRSDAGYFSNSFEIGGIAGTLALGALSDRLRRVPRSVVAATSLVGLAGALYLYLLVAGAGRTSDFFAMALVGALLFGPDALLSGAAAQDAGGPLAAALAAGVVNGVGSLGAVLQELVTRGVSGRFGWTALFYVFLGLSLLAAVSLAPTFRPREAPGGPG
jgi:sugar phosphate permease